MTSDAAERRERKKVCVHRPSCAQLRIEILPPVLLRQDQLSRGSWPYYERSVRTRLPVPVPWNSPGSRHFRKGSMALAPELGTTRTVSSWDWGSRWRPPSNRNEWFVCKGCVMTPTPQGIQTVQLFITCLGHHRRLRKPLSFDA